MKSPLVHPLQQAHQGMNTIQRKSGQVSSVTLPICNLHYQQLEVLAFLNYCAKWRHLSYESAMYLGRLCPISGPLTTKLSNLLMESNYHPLKLLTVFCQLWMPIAFPLSCHNLWFQHIYEDSEILASYLLIPNFFSFKIVPISYIDQNI